MKMLVFFCPDSSVHLVLHEVCLIYGEHSADLSWASGFVWAYVKYPCLSTRSVSYSCVTIAIGISDGNSVTQLVCACRTKGWSHHMGLTTVAGTSWELMLLYWMSVAYNVFPCSVKIPQGQPTKYPLKMSGKSKQRTCVVTAVLFSLWLSKAIVSAKQATCTSPWREMGSWVRCLLILGSSTQKVFSSNSVNIPLPE